MQRSKLHTILLFKPTYSEKLQALPKLHFILLDIRCAILYEWRLASVVSVEIRWPRLL
jgi:hypothetical protein